MYVAPSRRGSGLARRLLEELHAIARERGCRAIRLDTSAYLTPAVGLYRGPATQRSPTTTATAKPTSGSSASSEPIQL